MNKFPKKLVMLSGGRLINKKTCKNCGWSINKKLPKIQYGGVPRLDGICGKIGPTQWKISEKPKRWGKGQCLDWLNDKEVMEIKLKNKGW